MGSHPLVKIVLRLHHPLADEWVTQMLRQSDAQVFKKYSQMKLMMKREALEKLNRRANEMAPVAAEVLVAPLCTVTVQ